MSEPVAAAYAAPSATAFRLAYEQVCDQAVDATTRALAAAALAASHPDELLAALAECAEWALLISASDRSAEGEGFVASWLARGLELANALAKATPGGALPLPRILATGQLLHAACVVVGEGLHHARCAALWHAFERAVDDHPTTRRALGLADRVRAERWRYRDLARHAMILAAREQVDTDTILGAALGVVPLPLTPSDDIERRAGRTGYAHSALDAALWSIARLDLQPHDTFYDLGAGLGLPAILAALQSNASCTGVELHAHLVARAQHNARRLGLDNVRFVQADATSVDLRAGTKFYLFNPFMPEVLVEIIARLAEVARHHPIRVACVHAALPGFRLIAATDGVQIYEGP
jgi:SAM-dependent methyltransferase